MTVSATVGVAFTATYTPTVNGTPTDITSAGGVMNSLTVYDTDGTTVLATTTSWTHSGTAQYTFNVPAINKVGSFVTKVIYTPFTGATQVVDTDETTVVYAFGGSLGAPLSALNGLWTYSQDPVTSDKDTVRFLLGDTDPTDPLLTDGGIAFLLSQWTDVYSAAAAGAEQIAGQFAREVANSGDSVSVDFSVLQEKYMLLAGQLRALGKRKGRTAQPYVGGMSKAETRAALADTDTELTLFAVGMNDDTREGANGGGNSSSRKQLLSDQSYGGAST